MGSIDRLTTPRAAKAIVSWRILLGIGSGVALGLAGLPVGVAIAVGVALYAASIGAALSDDDRRPPIDPFTVGEPWRHIVQQAITADRKFRDTVNHTPEGPLRETLDDLAERIDRAVDEAWAVARRGDEIDDALRRVDPTALRSRLAAAEREQAARASDDTGLAGDTVASLRRQLDAAERLRALSDETAASLRLTQTRLDELVARASEIQIGTLAPESYRQDVDDLVIRLEALRQAIGETERA